MEDVACLQGLGDLLQRLSLTGKRDRGRTIDRGKGEAVTKRCEELVGLLGRQSGREHSPAARGPTPCSGPARR